MRSLLLLFACSMTYASDSLYFTGEATWWFKNAKVIHGTWDSPTKPTRIFALVRDGKDLLVNERTGQVTYGDVHKTVGFAFDPADVIDRSPPSDCYVYPEYPVMSVGKSGDLTIGDKNVTYVVTLAHIVMKRSEKKNPEYIKDAISDQANVRIWERSRSDQVGSALILLSNQGSKTLQERLVRAGVAIYNTTECAPFWWDAELRSAQEHAKETGIGIWSTDPVWAQSQVEKQEALIIKRSDSIARLFKEFDAKKITEKGNSIDDIKALNVWLATVQDMRDREEPGATIRQFLRQDPAMLRRYAKWKYARWLADAFAE